MHLEYVQNLFVLKPIEKSSSSKILLIGIEITPLGDCEASINLEPISTL